MAVYVITGARTGIGLEYVRQLAPTPSNTVIALVRSLSADLSALRAIQSQNPSSQVHILECDVSSPSSIAALPSKLLSLPATNPTNRLTIDVLINNAAILHSRTQTALSLTSDALLSHITTNVLGPALLFQTLYPFFSGESNAKAINITSGIASLALVHDGTINAEITAYSISKAALNMLTVHQARQEVERKERGEGKGVVVVCIDPGHVKTEMGGEGATVEVGDSARGVLRVVEGLQEGDQGRFFGYTGDEVPW